MTKESGISFILNELSRGWVVRKVVSNNIAFKVVNNDKGKEKRRFRSNTLN